MNKPIIDFESEGFNWLKVLKFLAQGGRIGVMEHEDLCAAAGSWPTCACGQLCQKLPRHSDGDPEDPLLFTLGIDFCGQVELAEWSDALATFQKIEARTKELLEAMPATPAFES